MPELPEVETVARTLRPRLVGRQVLSVSTSGLRLRAPVDRVALERATRGASIAAVRRVGKYLVVELSSQQALLVHLGMTGRLTVVATATVRAPHTHVTLGLDGGEELRYVDPRRFGVLQVYAHGALASSPELATLGPDPLGDAFTLEGFLLGLTTSRRDIKQFLLDQTRVAGLGNIYVCEALYRARVSPRRRADTVGKIRGRRLFDAIREVLDQAVRHRGTTLRDYVDGGGEPGGNQFHLDAYGREGEPCNGCGRLVSRIVQGARSTFYCGHCQR